MTIVSGLNLRLLLILAVVILAAYGAWRNRPRRGSTSLTAFMLVLAVIVGAHFMSHLQSGPLELVFIKLRWTGLFALPFFVLAFALAFADREGLLNRIGIAGIFAIPAFIAVFLMAPTVAGLVGLEILSKAVTNFLNQDGPVYLLSIGLAYLTLFAASVIILYQSYQFHPRFRRQGLILAGGIGILWIGTAIEVFGLIEPVHVHWVQNSFLVLGLTVLWAVYGGEVTDITPHARSTILETLDVGILVVDERGVITDINPAAKRLLEATDERLVGTSLTETLADHDRLLDSLDNDQPMEVELSTSSGQRILSPQVTPLTDTTDEEIGQVILLKDITEQRRQRDELRRQNERLENFANVLSHDLRNPLNVAVGRLELAAAESDSEHLEAVADALDEIGTLIDELLTLASVGDDIGELERVDLSSLVESCWRNVETESAELVTDTETIVMADKTRLRQLITNLMRNAVEHAGPQVIIRIGDLPDGFFIEDNGPGIPEENRAEVFETNYTTTEGGTGFGLSIVREIAQAHGWEITLTESSDGGVRFEFTGIEAE